MNIGCLSINAPTGVGFEMRWIMDQVSNDHSTFFLSVPDGRFSAPSSWDNIDNQVTFQRFIPIISAIIWVVKNKIDIVICKQEQFNDSLLKVFNILGIKTIVSVDLEDFDYQNDKWNFCDLFICPTKHSYDYLEEKGFTQKILSYMGLDSTYFKFIERKKNESMLYLHTAGHGGVGFRKSTPETVLAFELASRLNSNIKLLILSQISLGKYPLNIQKIIKNNDRIEFRNTRDKNNIEKYKENFSLYLEGDIAIQPSKWEGMGASIYEALMMGLPVLTTNYPPMNEYVNNSRGFLISPENYKNLCKYNKVLNKDYMMASVNVGTLAKEILMTSKINSLKEKTNNARKFMEAFDWNNVSEDWSNSFKLLKREDSAMNLSFFNIWFLLYTILYECLFYIPFMNLKNGVKFFLRSKIGSL